MKYELAKQLKDTGFPQDRDNPRDGAYVFETPESTAWVYAPTLSELIEACGDKFSSIQLDNRLPDAKLGKWRASSSWGARYIIFKGSTPEESVAKLWLALNKDK